MTTLKELECQLLTQLSPLKGKGPWHQKAWKHFLEKGFPDKHHEAYRYVSLRKLYETPLALLPCIVPSDLPASLVILPLEEASLHFHAYLEKQRAEWFAQESDPFAWMGAALGQEGLFIYVPPGVHVEKPLEIQAPAHVSIYVAPGGTCRLRLMYDEDKGGWHHRKFEAQVDEGGQLHVQFDPGATMHLDTIRVVVKKEGHFSSYFRPSAAPLARQDYHVRLVGEAAEARLHGLLRGKERQQHHVHVLIEHVAYATRSWQHFKAVLEEHAHHSFEGKIYVHAEAQKTDAYQMHNALILSPYAKSQSKPNLEIFADDVKASHGATCGQLDKEALFYLKARGIPEKAARDLLIQAFCAEVERSGC